MKRISFTLLAILSFVFTYDTIGQTFTHRDSRWDPNTGPGAAHEDANMGDVYDVQVNRDNDRVYVSVLGAGGGSGILTYDMDASGNLTFRDFDGAGGGTRGIKISPDKKHVYMCSQTANAIYYFDIAGDGSLSPAVGSPYVSATYCNNLYDIEIAPNNIDVYAVSFVDDQIEHFKRNPGDGSLVWQDAATKFVGGVNARLNNLENVEVSKDGKYLGTNGDDAICWFSINPDGSLNWINSYDENAANPGPVSPIVGVDNCTDIAISPDAKFVYAVDGADDQLGVFEIQADGTLHYIQTITDNAAMRLDRPASIEISPDNLFVAVMATMDAGGDAINIYSVNADGTLTFQYWRGNGHDTGSGASGTKVIHSGYRGAFSFNGFYLWAENTNEAISTWEFVEAAPVGLSVEMSEFDGFLNSENQTELFWKTESETDNDYFSVQRSENGIDFDEVGVVAGSGSTNGKHSYDFIDIQPLTGVSYYRLEQFDFDATSTLSKVIAINNSGECGVAMYPSPVKNELYVLPGTCSGNNSRTMQVNVYDVNGRLVKSIFEDYVQGDILVDMSMVSTGVYFISVNDGNSVVRQKVFKK